jgi:hypothetical protein
VRNRIWEASDVVEGCRHRLLGPAKNVAAGAFWCLNGPFWPQRHPPLRTKSEQNAIFEAPQRRCGRLYSLSSRLLHSDNDSMEADRGW